MTNRLFLFATFMVFPAMSFAYLDPGTGSIIFQALIAGAMGALYFVKIFWGNIKGFFSNAYRRMAGSGKND